MAFNQQKTAVILVPGIMGSTLFYKQPGLGGFIETEIWSKDASITAFRLATEPTQLLAANVEAREVIDYMKLPGLSYKKDVYGSLIRFCTSSTGLGLTPAKQFYEFPYDWRQDNFASGQKLAQFIKSIDQIEQRRYRIIAHSMGGIVARLMLLENRDIAERTEVVIQIGSPIFGAACAFRTLKQKLSLHPVLDKILERSHRRRPEVMREVLQTFASLYQVLPPSQVTTIVGQTGTQWNALDRHIWPESRHNLLDNARRVHEKLATPVPTTVISIYANTEDTEYMYRVDERHELVKSLGHVEGDGTVVCDSATKYSEPNNQRRFSERGIDHLSLCHHPAVHRFLHEVLV